MTILVFGKNGQVSNEIKESKKIIKLGRDEVNLLNLSQIEKTIRKINPDAVINTAAETNVDSIEKNSKNAFVINSKAPIKMAEVCKDLDIPFLHISTDYVFDGNSKKPYLPYELTNPINKYGKLKLFAENGIIKLGGKFVILRTSWVFSEKNNNFLFKIIKKTKNEKILKVVSDQTGSPTPAKEIANACLIIVEKILRNNNLYGIYHLTGKPYTNWYNFAKFICKVHDSDVKIIPIKTKDFNSIALRPKNSKLNCVSLKKCFNIDRPEWKISVIEILNKNKKNYE